MRNLRTPGVYIREVEVKPAPRLRLDIAGFVGQAERGPLNFPQPLTSWGEYRDVFGDFVNYGYLPYCVFTLFANAGEKCYVTRVAHESARRAKLALYSQKEDENGESVPLIHVEAINEGDWGDSIKVVAESASSDDLILTELEDDLPAGRLKTRFKSVQGLLDGQSAGEGKGDSVKLIHPRNPTLQAQAIIKQINFEQRTVEFEEPASNDLPFPGGSRVLGKGFRLVFRYIRNGRLIRGELFDN